MWEIYELYTYATNLLFVKHSFFKIKAAGNLEGDIGYFNVYL